MVQAGDSGLAEALAMSSVPRIRPRRQHTQSGEPATTARAIVKLGV